MMTLQRKKRLKRLIQSSRERLMETHPYFALLLMYLEFTAVPGMKKISTNGHTVYFSPDYIEKLYGYELDYMLCHQIMHIVCGHIFRPYDLLGDDYHLACDISLNCLLKQVGFEVERYPHLGKMNYSLPGKNVECTEMTPEEILGKMVFSLYILDDRARSSYLPDSDEWWDKKGNYDEIGEKIIEVRELDDPLFIKAAETSDDAGELKNKWQIRVAYAASTMKTHKSDVAGAGNTSEFLERIVEKKADPIIDWKKLINEFLQEQICDYSFLPPDRRFSDTGFFLPDFNEKEFVQKEILFFVDTSGSVSNEELAEAYAEISGAVEQFDGKISAKLGFFDTEVVTPIPFSNIEELCKIIPYGGGGTNFRCIFDYIQIKCTGELPASVVIITDGYGPYPAESAAMGIPVLWLINNTDITPPFGKVARFLRNK